LPSIADVVALAKPSVVAITTEVVARDIFNRPVTQQGAGSGWIVDSNGIIVTNNHVVEGANTVTVTLSDGRVFTAQEVKTDAFTDLAIVRVNATGLPAAKIGSAARLRVGDWVVAIGNPLGLGISAKEGIISRIGVSLPVSEGQTLYNLLETSAAINPGNSGGPLLNMSGEVIGITSAKIATVGVEGLGYAISVDNATPIISELVQVGCIIRSWLGVESFTIDGGLSVIFGLPVDKGAIVTLVVTDSPAARAGIRQNDIIVSFQGKAINSSPELIQAEHSSQIGQRVMITLWRGNNKVDVDVTIAESPPCE
jgi:serine protease Do